MRAVAAASVQCLLQRGPGDVRPARVPPLRERVFQVQSAGGLRRVQEAPRTQEVVGRGQRCRGGPHIDSALRSPLPEQSGDVAERAAPGKGTDVADAHAHPLDL
jgi:hypothetical protein